MTPADASRAAGFPSANLLYNFLGGRSNSLSQETMEKLVRVIPGATLESLTRDVRALVKDEPVFVTVRMQARAGVFETKEERQTFAQFRIPVPIGPRYVELGAFGVVVRSPGIERLYPDGTVLICVPLNALVDPIQGGRRIVLRRMRGKAEEISIRDVVVSGGEVWLWPRSDEPEHQAPVQMPRIDPSQAWPGQSEKLQVVGSVVLACIPEDGAVIR